MWIYPYPTRQERVRQIDEEIARLMRERNDLTRPFTPAPLPVPIPIPIPIPMLPPLPPTSVFPWAPVVPTETGKGISIDDVLKKVK